MDYGTGYADIQLSTQNGILTGRGDAVKSERLDFTLKPLIHFFRETKSVGR